jgi:hypothetical protein
MFRIGVKILEERGRMKARRCPPWEPIEEFLAAAILDFGDWIVVLSLEMARSAPPTFSFLWDAGEPLLRGEPICSAPDITIYASPVCDIKIAAAQIVCEGDLERQVARLVEAIREPARQQADIVVLPELAPTGDRLEDILAASRASLDDTLARVGREARQGRMHVIVGSPRLASGRRENSSYVLGEGTISQPRNGVECRLTPEPNPHSRLHSPTQPQFARVQVWPGTPQQCHQRP